MPPLQLPFLKLPSAPPPGSSYYISNALIVAKRVALGLENPVRIQSGVGWESGNPLFDWYERHGAFQVECMQLRRETKAPFFHEYVALRLSNSSCFRIDRRQLPDERLPMGCTEHEGVEPYDTIEQIADMEDSMYSPSECLVQLDFRQSISLNRITWIIRRIVGHKWARVYTLQRYNCYFYAQTILLCTCFSVCGWDGTFIWDIPDPWTQDFLDLGVIFTLWERNRIGKNGDIRIGLRLPMFKPSRLPEPHLPFSRTTSRNAFLQVLQDILNGAKPRETLAPVLEESSIQELLRYLEGTIRAHSIRVEQYKFLLKHSAADVDCSIKAAMNDIWRETVDIPWETDDKGQEEMNGWMAGMGL